MANYSLSPYAIWLGVRNARGGERRPIADIDGLGTTLRSGVLKVLRDLAASTLTPDSADDSRLLRVARLQEFKNFIFVEFGVARGGLEGNLHKAKSDSLVPIAAADASETFVRAVFVFPEAAHEAYWLSERAGNSSAFSFILNRLSAHLTSKFPDFTTHVDPVAEWSAVNEWASNVLVKQIRFDAPRPGNSTQAMDVNGVNAEISVIVKPRGGLVLSKLLKKEGPRKLAVFGFLSQGIYKSNRGVSAAKVIEQGWKAKVSFTTPSGHQRSFGVETGENPPSLIYDMPAPAGTGARAFRPADKVFLSTCSQVMSDVSANLSTGTTLPSELSEARPAK